MSTNSKSRILELSPERCERMRGVSWHEDLPSPALEDLRLLRIPYVDFDGEEREGELVTVKTLAEQVLQIFEALHEQRFPIASMRPMVEFGGDDGASMAANNTSCFNSRRIMGSTRVSLHALGQAIDINPIQNPVIRDGIVRPDAGRAYLDREEHRQGMVHSDCPATRVFLDAGWKWGGNWDNPKDYHHYFIEL